jgi:hypothetical protein
MAVITQVMPHARRRFQPKPRKNLAVNIILPERLTLLSAIQPQIPKVLAFLMPLSMNGHDAGSPGASSELGRITTVEGVSRRCNMPG